MNGFTGLLFALFVVVLTEKGCTDAPSVEHFTPAPSWRTGSHPVLLNNKPSKMQRHPLDPSVYSLGPNASIPEESFDESEDVRRWDGGSTDFTFTDDDEPPVAKMELPEPEQVVSDED